jgi:hypothetical protein
VVWLPDGLATRSREDGGSDSASSRVELVNEVSRLLGSTLDPTLLALDHAAALLEVPKGEPLAASLLTEPVQGALVKLGNSILGTGNLRDKADYELGQRLSVVALGDVARLAAFVADDGATGTMRDLAVDLERERQIFSSGFSDDFEVAIGRTITERNGGNFKGGGEHVENASVELAEELIEGAWVHYRFAVSMLTAKRFGSGRDPHGWLASSPLDDLGDALGVLRQLDPRDAAAADLVAHVEELIASDAWRPHDLTQGVGRPLVSEYLYVLDARGDT